MTGKTSDARTQRSLKRKQHLVGRAERERVAELPESWLTPRGRAILLAVLILLLAGAVAATVWRAEVYASAASDAQAFQHAPSCAPAPATQTDCVLNIPVSVDGTWSESGGRNSSTAYYVALSGSAPANGTVQLTGAYPLPTGPGEVADALVWRGQVVALLGGTGDQYDTVNAPGLAADQDLNWLVAAALCALAFLAVPLSLFTRLRGSLWRHALTFPSVLAAGSFTVGAAIGGVAGSGLHTGLYVGAGFFGFFGIITALVARNLYREGRL
jgi:hypothetical protein